MSKPLQAIGIEIDPKRIGVLLTDQVGDTLRLFCFSTNATITQVDVPAEENADNLRALFVAMSVEETCSSLILDEVVQGRFYVKSEDKYWLYTLLKSAQDRLPPFNANLARLPWRIAWLSREAQVLEYGWPGGEEHCFCIRKEITENDAARLVKNSKAFTQPVSSPRKQPPSRGDSVLRCMALLMAGILISAAIVYSTWEFNHTPIQAQAIPQISSDLTGSPGFSLLYNHQISGPFPATTVAGMNAAGLLRQEVLCRPYGSTDWLTPAEAFHPAPTK